MMMPQTSLKMVPLLAGGLALFLGGLPAASGAQLFMKRRAGDGPSNLGSPGDVYSHVDSEGKLSFTQVLSSALKSDAFQKEVGETVPMMCDGAENESACKDVITKALVCTNFVQKAKSFPPDMEGIAAFIQRCERIEKRVPNFSSIAHWVQTPDSLFETAVKKAEARTGVSLNSPLAALQAIGDLDDGKSPDADPDVAGDGLPPLNGGDDGSGSQLM